MPTYFGYQTDPDLTYDSGWGGYLGFSYATYTCPGSGNQNIQELSAYVYSATGGHIRMGVYLGSSNALIAEGTAEITVTSTHGWQGHMTQASVKAAGGVSPGVLVGGVEYHFGMAIDDNAIHISDTIQLTNKSDYMTGDYTGGMATTLSGEGPGVAEYHFRCGVDPAGGGLDLSTKRIALCG